MGCLESIHVFFLIGFACFNFDLYIFFGLSFFICLSCSNSRDYSQDLDALVASKPPNLKVDMLAMFQDHVQKNIQKAIGGSAGQDVSADVEDAED